MSIFIVCCLLLAFLVKSQSVYLSFLLEQWVWVAGSAAALVFLLLGWWKKLSSTVWHDGFATAVLWAWYSDWQPLFDHDAPMLYLFPIYYALLTGWMTLTVINKSPRFDSASRDYLIYLQHNLARFDTGLLACLVLVSLFVSEHYLLYPIAMTLFIVRFTLQRCLEIIESQ